MRKLIVLVALCWGLFQAHAQVPAQVKATVDTTAIKIGEQIQYTIAVEADSTAQVTLPEGQTFGPLELVEALLTDTIRHQDRVTLQRTYVLTQFDSGAYTLPPQKVMVGSQGFLTDSIAVAVSTVPVDTLNQKMYDIKPLLEVEKSTGAWWKIVFWVLLGALLLGGLLYWFVWREKPLSQEEQEALLPPYDRALLELDRLEKSKYLIQAEYKQYYSELTDIVRSYLEEDARIDALESTTDQLITKLELLRDAGELKLEDDTLVQFKRILETADLVKFARSKPATSIAEQHREAIKGIVVKTKEALPEPTVEELMETQAYQEEQQRKKRQQKLVRAMVVLGALLVVSSVGAIAYFGFEPVKDTVLRHPSRLLKKGDWVSSSYGFPPITISTPQVLYRQMDPIAPVDKSEVKEEQDFAYSSPDHLFMVKVRSVTYNQQQDPDCGQATEKWVLADLESRGGRNITTKQEEFKTVAGVVGVKVYGSVSFEDGTHGKYTVLCFGGKGFLQQVFMAWEEGDVHAQEMVDRMLMSVDVKTTL